MQKPNPEPSLTLVNASVLQSLATIHPQSKKKKQTTPSITQKKEFLTVKYGFLLAR